VHGLEAATDIPKVPEAEIRNGVVSPYDGRCHESQKVRSQIYAESSYLAEIERSGYKKASVIKPRLFEKL
jgi:hypothetical protein